MLPSNSNLSKENCSSTSSNCVVWQGPDIACINLCKGDSISDVTYKLAEEICILKENIGVTDVDLTCLVKVCQTTPEPSKTLANILDLLISKVCCLSDIVEGLPTPGETYVEPTINYPACSAFTGLTNDLHKDYTYQLAQKICSIFTTVSNHTSILNQYGTRISDLEALVPTPLPNLPSCLSGTTLALNVVVQNLENEFCDIKDALGDQGDLATAKGQICTNLNSQKQLIDSNKLMIEKAGWITTPQNFAESVNNLWITVCDIRSAVRSILDNCCKAGCDDIVIDFYQKWSTDTPGLLLLNFKSKSKMPLGFYDCGQPTFPFGSNKFKLVDALGMEVELPPTLFRHINYTQTPSNTTGILDDPNLDYGWAEFDLSTTGLDLDAGPLQMSAELCFTDGSTQCIKCVSFTINPEPATKCCEIKATGEVTIIYSTCSTPSV